MKTALLVLVCTVPLAAAQRVTLCEVEADRAAFDGRELEVAAFVSYGFEDFTLFDPRCSDASSRVWVEYATNSVEDRKRKQFDRLLRRDGGSIVHATLRGRFLSGEKTELPGGTTWIGYGHFGLYSLFAIEQVVAVDPHDLRNVDYRSVIDEPSLETARCFSQPFSLSHPDAIELQRQADAGPRAWSFTDPRRVAREQLQKPDRRLHVVRKRRGSISYRAGNEYVVVSRPYWLSFFAKDRRRVAWVPVAVYEIGCKE